MMATVNDAIGGLRALDVPVDQWDVFLVYFVSRRLDRVSLEEWELQRGNTTELASFSELAEFVDGRVRALEMVGTRGGNREPKPAVKPATKAKQHAKVAAAASPGAITCACCKASHYIAACPEFTGKSVEQRRQLVVTNKLCYNCLGTHKVQECRTAKRCRLCQGQHHTLIHPDSSGSTAAVGASSSSSAVPDASGSQAGSATALSCSPSGAGDARRSQTLLATARVIVTTDQGDSVEVRALLDQGSELTFVRESLVQALRLSRRGAAVPIMGVGAARVGSTRGMSSIRLRSRMDPSSDFICNAYILPRLVGTLPSGHVPAKSWSHLRDLDLADPGFAMPGQIDLILGADVYAHVLLDEVRRGSADAPIAQRTILGWIVSGPVGVSQTRGTPWRGVSCTGQGSDDLRDLLQRFWLQEEVSAARSAELTPDEAKCEAHFATTHSREPSGRYCVRLPFRISPSRLGETHSAAVRSLQRARRRVSAGGTFAGLYEAFLLEYEQLGHMHLADHPNAGAVFLPHHGVLKESSSTTKLRVVFNGSWRTATGLSLNDCLHVGPRLQRDLFDVLLRWRKYPYVFLADIEKMYRQILVHPEDRDYQRILWDVSGNTRQYRLATVTYGLSSAPYLALRVLKQLADDEGRRFPLAVDILRSEMYVDDVLSGAYSVDQAQLRVGQLDGLLMAGGFRLGKWLTNTEEVLASIDRSRHAVVSARNLEDEAVARALGLAWLPASDTFGFSFQVSALQGTLTKRTVLSRTAQLFDPMGWIAPVIITAKILIQQLWRDSLEWDDPLPPFTAAKWRAFEGELGMLSECAVPRWLGTATHDPTVEVHGFSDASQEAMGAVLYLRVMGDELHEIRVSLLVAKSRVAPVKKQTIPRLELAAALIMARLASRVIPALGFDRVQLHFWVDSSVALTWIRGSPSRWKEFVANRVAAIQELVPRGKWRHVAGTENPADCASRGLTPGELRSHGLWWRGPPWLRQPSTSWPSTGPLLDEAVDLEERPATTLAARAAEVTPIWELIERYSDLKKLLQVTAWIRRAIARMRRSQSGSSGASIMPEELSEAEVFWVRRTQEAHFSAELLVLARGSELPRAHPLLRLSPFVDARGVLRMGGRLRNAMLDPEAKHPAILPRDATITRLVLCDAHQRTLHGGVQLMLATIRQRYWVLGGRAPVSAFVRSCVRCARYRARTAQELMGQLPRTRVSPSRAFQHSGVDYAGPFELKTWRGRGARIYKGFLIIFVCFSTSATHLEIATDYSTQGFLAAYKRFTSRRGICESLTSDCGTNLVGADAELRRLFRAASTEMQALRHSLSRDGTAWHFNPPSAPHFGGKWEAAVKSVKFHLRRVVGDSRLTYEEFSTLLTQIEAVLNSRPLCALTDNPEDVEALTPAHFLVGGPLVTVPEPSLTDVEPNRLSRWQLIRHVFERFWQRWSSECLQRLQSLGKWRRPVGEIALGTVVLITDERCPPSKWPLARVIAVHPGADGLIRVVTVRTATTTLKRPIVKLCPLPVSA